MSIELSQFCHALPGEWTAWMKVPFVRRGYRYATDGRIAVRVSAPDVPDSGCDNRDRVTALHWPADDECNTPWPTKPVGEEDDMRCEVCNGSAYKDRTICPECDGDGEGEYKCPTCDNVVDCKRCAGKGYLNAGERCAACYGQGQVHGTIAYNIGGARIATKYHKLILALPHVRYRPPTNQQAALAFIFDGGQGLVMPRA